MKVLHIIFTVVPYPIWKKFIAGCWYVIIAALILKALEK